MPESSPPPVPDAGDSSAEATAVAAARKATSHLRHELRTPINQIIGYSELLQEEAEDLGQASLVADLGKITLAGRRLLELVERGLDALLLGHDAVPPVEPAAVAVATEHLAAVDTAEPASSSAAGGAEPGPAPMGGFAAGGRRRRGQPRHAGPAATP